MTRLQNRLANEDGAVIALAAVLIPVFLVLVAMSVDVGTWYTHKRQLQNRADAGALAAGRQLADSWPACITDTASEDAITAVAKRYAGDINNDVTAVNTEIAARSRFNVVVNSSSADYTAGSDHTDGVTGPCQPHAANSAPENEANITPAGGTWVDVKVKEHTASLFGWFGMDLIKNRARARVELLESVALNNFIPIAIPEQTVEKARIRFVNMCNNSEIQSSNLTPLTAQTEPGMSLWGPDPGGNPGTMSLTMPTTVPVPNTPAASTCGDSFLDHTPIRVELRLAGRSDIDLSNAVTCAQLQAATAADCYPQISTIRSYQPSAGLFGDRPQIRDVRLNVDPSGTRPCVRDAYYSRATSTPDCLIDTATVFMDWGSRPTANAIFNATIEVDGSTARALAGPTPQGIWTAAQVPIGEVGPDWVKVSWSYELQSGSWGPGGLSGCNNKNNNPCKQQGTTTVHAANLGNEPGGSDSPSDVVGAVKLTQGPSISSFEEHSAPTNTTLTPFVTIGLRTAFQVGNWTVLRLDEGGLNFSIVCDPYWDQPSTPDSTASFWFGCQPPYARNNTNVDSFWWSTATKHCPPDSQWLLPPSGTWPNQTYANTPWRCVLLDPGGNGQSTGDGIALVTRNCRNPVVDPRPGDGADAACQGHQYDCLNPPTYFGSGPLPSDEDYRRVKLFVVPWNAYKNAKKGSKETIPVLRLATFYITSWRFNGREDPCVNLNAQTQAEYARLGAKGDKLSGYFVKEVTTSGAGNPTRSCDPNAIDICTVTLTR